MVIIVVVSRLRRLVLSDRFFFVTPANTNFDTEGKAAEFLTSETLRYLAVPEAPYGAAGAHDTGRFHLCHN